MCQSLGRFLVMVLLSAGVCGCGGQPAGKVGTEGKPGPDKKAIARTYVQGHIDRLLGGDKTVSSAVGTTPSFEYAGGQVAGLST
jgi:hypothetical protein